MLAGGIDPDQFRLRPQDTDPFRQRPAGADPAQRQFGRQDGMAERQPGDEDKQVRGSLKDQHEISLRLEHPGRQQQSWF